MSECKENGIVENKSEEQGKGNKYTHKNSSKGKINDIEDQINVQK